MTAVSIRQLAGEILSSLPRNALVCDGRMIFPRACSNGVKLATNEKATSSTYCRGKLVTWYTIVEAMFRLQSTQLPLVSSFFKLASGT